MNPIIIIIYIPAFCVYSHELEEDVFDLHVQLDEAFFSSMYSFKTAQHVISAGNIFSFMYLPRLLSTSCQPTSILIPPAPVYKSRSFQIGTGFPATAALPKHKATLQWKVRQPQRGHVARFGESDCETSHGWFTRCLATGRPVNVGVNALSSLS